MIPTTLLLYTRGLKIHLKDSDSGHNLDDSIHRRPRKDALSQDSIKSREEYTSP